MKTKLEADGIGLVVPMNIEAMCVAENVGPKFQPEPYDFRLLPETGGKTRPFLSKEVMTTDLRPMDTGVHLHWALPDGLTKGAARQDGEGAIAFPKTPDRWLVTRIFSDLSNVAKPVNKIKSWVVESNYVSKNRPDPDRPSMAVPFKPDEDKHPDDHQQFRYLGRVLEYETWRSNYLQNANDSLNNNDKYANGLSAVGYGSPTFSASYATSKSIFGFFDIDKDLAKLGNDIMLSYQVVGWYHNEGDDPVNQLPLQFNQVDFDGILEAASKEDKLTLNQFYKIFIEDGAYVLVKDISAEDQLRVINALTSSGFDFLGSLLNRCKWSVPSGTVETKPQVTHTLFTGLISNVKWNRDKSAFNGLGEEMRIAIGDTSSQALAALIAKVSDLSDPALVEWLLNALQLGKLKDLSKLQEGDRIEQLNMALHTSGYNSSAGGELWEVTKVDDKDKDDQRSLKSLAQNMGADLNELNKRQFAYDQGLNEIESARKQIFMDWYRYIQVLRRNPDTPPPHGLSARDIMIFITKQIKALENKTKATNQQSVNQKAEEIRRKLPKGYQLVTTSALRYWQPAEPVILFHGDEITPPERYGGDGRFMPDKSLVCRLSSQLINKAIISKGAVGNNTELVFSKENLPHLPLNMPLQYAEQIYALFTESCLVNPMVMSVLCKAAGAINTQSSIEKAIKAERDKSLTPAVPALISASTMDQISGTISAADYAFLLKFYKNEGDSYALKVSEADIAEKDLKRLQYILISASVTPESFLHYSGIVPSLVYFVEWDNNPWLPYLLTWKVNYYPVAEIKPDSDKDINYEPDFITSNFELGYADNEFMGEPGTITQTFKNSIFLTPHAQENFQEQIQKYIDGQPLDKVDKEKLEEIKEKLKKVGSVLSQSLNGFNDGLVMRDQVMQLQVTDLVNDDYQDFTNEDVRNTVANLSKSAPKPSDYYNPIRAGYMRIDSVTIVDVFGYTLQPSIKTYGKVIIAENLKSHKDKKDDFVYLAPRIAQPSRLQFRWLAAEHDNMETNSHPDTTPICGWIMANHLQPGLWFYNADGTPIGTLTLSEDRKNVLWQAAPKKDAASDISLTNYFKSEDGQKVNNEMKNIMLALYNDRNGAYLDDFLRANDVAFRAIKPAGQQQTGSNAVLMSSPIAVAQATLGIQIKGWPAYSNGWADLKTEIDQSRVYPDRIENGFTNVKFPVRLGNSAHTNDGLLGFFKKEDNYEVYRAREAGRSLSGHVVQSTDSDVELALRDSLRETVVTLLLDPRGSVHAITGVLPAKAIDIPPSQYADALDNIQIAFLTAPVLYDTGNPAMPMPAQSGGEWAWLHKELEEWAESQVQPVDDQARLTGVPQEIREGWLLLTNFSK
ncbi:hypothetical protein [Mucilaginibacter lappiensis]|uniref:hypothetical protein n=1 Tax=Mucilaginibacter lappiensis TaxID=354630 RepID=UPI003D1FD170